jgi:hypothetical protein
MNADSKRRPIISLPVIFGALLVLVGGALMGPKIMELYFMWEIDRNKPVVPDVIEYDPNEAAPMPGVGGADMGGRQRPSRQPDSEAADQGNDSAADSTPAASETPASNGSAEGQPDDLPQ